MEENFIKVRKEFIFDNKENIEVLQTKVFISEYFSNGSFIINTSSENVKIDFFINSKEKLQESIQALDKIAEMCTRLREDLKQAYAFKKSLLSDQI